MREWVPSWREDEPEWNGSIDTLVEDDPAAESVVPKPVASQATVPRTATVYVAKTGTDQLYIGFEIDNGVKGEKNTSHCSRGIRATWSGEALLLVQRLVRNLVTRCNLVNGQTLDNQLGYEPLSNDEVSAVAYYLGRVGYHPHTKQ